ncbi:hypothetical protein MMC26_001411 [Xylographa opegraphella]|nr:hypothetical protein [Xylographa opegraphella]
MLRSYFSLLCYHLLIFSIGTSGLPTFQAPLIAPSALRLNRTVSKELFYELEELARIVDISYCVGTTGIQKPFLCASRCQEFPAFELVTTWNTGPLLADSCGYIAVSHFPSPKRIIVAFRGTYSVANTIIDLSTIPQEYAPYPGEDGGDGPSESIFDLLWRPLKHVRRMTEDKCDNCTVHLGFMTSWWHTRAEILPHLEKAIKKYPDYQLTLVGHSLGGAVAALASLEFKARGWHPKVTTFGEPRIGNQPLMKYIDDRFLPSSEDDSAAMFRRVTHVDDPVPLLPLEEWGYKMHAGEVFISKPELSPLISDIQHCEGDEDPHCITGGDSTNMAPADDETDHWLKLANLTEIWNDGTRVLAIPARFKLWQLFFAHRDYFWRLGLCIPGGDPRDWYRKYPHNETDEL